MWIRFFAVFCLFSVATCNNIEIAGEPAAEIQNAHDGHNHEFGVEHVEQQLVLSSKQSPLSPHTTTETSFSNCLIFAVADDLKEHLTTDNVKPVTVLLQHSIQTCPGLNSTFEVFQKIMGFKGLDFAGVMNFISSLKVHNGTTTIPDEEVHADVPSTNVPSDENIEEAENDETTDAQDDKENAQSNDIESDVQIDEQEEKTSETPEVENTNIEDNYEDGIPASIESNHEIPALNEDHKDEYRRFWQEENLNNLREDEHLSEKMD